MADTGAVAAKHLQPPLLAVTKNVIVCATLVIQDGMGGHVLCVEKALGNLVMATLAAQAVYLAHNLV